MFKTGTGGSATVLMVKALLVRDGRYLLGVLLCLSSPQYDPCGYGRDDEPDGPLVLVEVAGLDEGDDYHGYEDGGELVGLEYESAHCCPWMCLMRLIIYGLSGV